MSVHEEHTDVFGKTRPEEEIWMVGSDIMYLLCTDKTWSIGLSTGRSSAYKTIENELVEKRNSLPNLFMKLNTNPDIAPLIISMAGNSEAVRKKTGIMTILPDEKYPAEEWSIHEKNQNAYPFSICMYTLYYDEGAWSLWIDEQLSGEIVLELGLRLADKRNTLKPSSSEATLNLTLDQIPKTL